MTDLFFHNGNFKCVFVLVIVSMYDFQDFFLLYLIKQTLISYYANVNYHHDCWLGVTIKEIPAV